MSKVLEGNFGSFHADGSDQQANNSGGGGGMSLEPRVAKLESDVENIKVNIADMKKDISGIRDELTENTVNIEKFKTQMSKEVGDFKTQMATDLGAIKIDIANTKSSLDKKISEMQLRLLGAIIGVPTVIYAIHRLWP